MAVIIDTNCLADVFSKSASNHFEFQPVLKWVLEGKGFIVYGGTKYKNELKKASKYLTIFRELKSVGKVFEGNLKTIDEIQKEIEAKENDSDFDDPHLPAIVIDTKCRIICSNDTRSIKYVTNSKFYPKHFRTPVYYTSSKNKDILCDEYVDDSLKPLSKITKDQREALKRLIK